MKRYINNVSSVVINNTSDERVLRLITNGLVSEMDILTGIKHNYSSDFSHSNTNTINNNSRLGISSRIDISVVSVSKKINQTIFKYSISKNIPVLARVVGLYKRSFKVRTRRKNKTKIKIYTNNKKRRVKVIGRLVSVGNTLGYVLRTHLRTRHFDLRKRKFRRITRDIIIAKRAFIDNTKDLLFEQLKDNVQNRLKTKLLKGSVHPKIIKLQKETLKIFKHILGRKKIRLRRKRQSKANTDKLVDIKALEDKRNVYEFKKGLLKPSLINKNYNYIQDLRFIKILKRVISKKKSKLIKQVQHLDIEEPTNLVNSLSNAKSRGYPYLSKIMKRKYYTILRQEIGKLYNVVPVTINVKNNLYVYKLYKYSY